MTPPSLSSSVHQRVCPWWVAYTFDNPLRKLFHKPQKVLGNYVKKGMAVMDLGCGMGYFSIGMAGLVGSTGKVIAVDLQQKMLDIMIQRAQRAGLAGRIVPHLGRADAIAIDQPVDFILAFWMVHEVPDQEKYFNHLKTLLAPGARILIAEPKMHVGAEDLKRTLDMAQSCGLQCIEEPDIRFSRAALLGPIPGA